MIDGYDQEAVYSMQAHSFLRRVLVKPAFVSSFIRELQNRI